MPKIVVDTDEFLSVDDAAGELKISVPTAWRRIKEGKIIVMRVSGRTLVPRSEVVRLTEGGTGV